MRITAICLTAAVLAACGGGEAPPPAATEAPAATETPAPASTETPGPAATASPAGGEPSAANAFIGSIAVDPKDGTMYLGTGLGLFRVPRGGGSAERVVGTLTTPQGDGTVSSNLVVRVSRRGELLASGHPQMGSLPENLGLIRSTDGAGTWTSVAQLGAADYHLLEPARGRLVAVEAEAPDVLVSADGGKSFEKRTPPAPPLDLAVDPVEPARIAVATEQGTFTSTNEGRSWRPRDANPGGVLAWAAPDKLYRADRRGEVTVSDDGGQSWQRKGSLKIGPNELAAGENGVLYASVPGGEVRTSRDGGASWKPYVKLK